MSAKLHVTTNKNTYTCLLLMKGPVLCIVIFASNESLLYVTFNQSYTTLYGENMFLRKLVALDVLDRRVVQNMQRRRVDMVSDFYTMCFLGIYKNHEDRIPSKCGQFRVDKPFT